MKKVMFVVTILAGLVSQVFAERPYTYVGIAKGDVFEGKCILVTSTQTNTNATILISSTVVVPNYDYLIKNYDGYTIFIGSHVNVGTSDIFPTNLSQWGFPIKKGESISVDGRLKRPVYARALTGNTTVAIILLKND